MAFALCGPMPCVSCVLYSLMLPTFPNYALYLVTLCTTHQLPPLLYIASRLCPLHYISFTICFVLLPILPNYALYFSTFFAPCRTHPLIHADSHLTLLRPLLCEALYLPSNVPSNLHCCSPHLVLCRPLPRVS